MTTPGGRVIAGPPPGRYWAISHEKLVALDADGRIWWGKDGMNVPALKRFLNEVKQGRVPQTYWAWEDVGHTQDAKKEAVLLLPDDPFGTPKPERLLQRILEIASNQDDLILDSFLGGGTTAAVAHKMGRRWIGVEMGEHARTHCVPRMQKVIEGEQGGISEAVSWKGGGGFRFYTLGETAFDAHGHINAAVRFATLAAYVWHLEVGEPGAQTLDSPLLGIHNGTAYYLLYNGILGDRRPAGGNVLTQPVLQHLHALAAHTGPKVIYGESSRLGPARLALDDITFKQIPYDIKMR